MHETQTVVRVDDLELSATATSPTGRSAVGGVVPLHGATAPSRDFFMYRHLAEVAAGLGWATLRYDRRPWERGTIPFNLQMSDALAAVAHLREIAELDRESVGLWGSSQGAWVATMAAAHSDEVSFLVLVGFSALTPGQQMRFLTANLLRREGFGDERSLEELRQLRDTYESFLRGTTDRVTAQRHIDVLRTRSWFELAYVPEELPALDDVAFPSLFDFDPTVPLSRAGCPLLGVWGGDDVEVPAAPCVEIVEDVRRDTPAETRLDILDGVGHTLTVDDADDIDALDPRYERILSGWLRTRLVPEVPR